VIYGFGIFDLGGDALIVQVTDFGRRFPGFRAAVRGGRIADDHRQW